MSVRSLPHEPLLAHLPTLLDPSHMGPILAGRMLGLRGRQVRCEIERVKYQPGKNCLVVYRLEVPDANVTDLVPLRVACRTYEPAGARSRFEKARRSLTGTADAAGRVLHLPDQEAVAWVFPQDRKLEHLRRLTDLPTLQREVVPLLAAALRPSAPPPHSVEHTVVHYVPEHTCSVRLTLGWPDAAHTAYGKTYYDDTGSTAFDHMTQAFALARDAGQVEVPRPLRYEPAARTLWQAAVPGERIAAMVDLAPRDLQQLAAALAAFHCLPVQRLPVLDPPRMHQRIAAASRLVEAAAPAHGPALRRLSACLAAHVELIAALGPTATLHGDLHPGNVLRTRERIHLIDLDSLQAGPALLDLGSWIASELVRAQLQGVTLAQTLDAAEDLCSLYADARDTPIPMRGWWLATAYALLTERVRRCVTRLKPGRLGLVGPLLDLAHDLCVRAGAESCP